MNTRLSLFDSPLFLGFDHFEQTFDRLKKHSSEGYPPYNIEQIGESGLRITLAVAGFTMDNLDVEIDHNQLTIRGRHGEEDDLNSGGESTGESGGEYGRIYLHRGIAARQFQRSFVLADGIEVVDASLDNGLLHIDMQRIVPESTARQVKIRSKKPVTGSIKKLEAIHSEKSPEKEG